MSEMFKVRNELASPVMDSIKLNHGLNESYNFRDFQAFLIERKRSVHCGLERLSYRSPQ